MKLGNVRVELALFFSCMLTIVLCCITCVNANAQVSSVPWVPKKAVFQTSPATVYQGFVSGDTQPRFTWNVAGVLCWGPGGVTACDTTLTRTGTGALTLNGTLNATTVNATNLTGALTGNVTGNASGTAGNVTATTNSTLTTLSALSLPATQLTGTLAAARLPALTGDVTAAAGTGATTLAATTNGTLTTLSALSLPATQLTGTLAAARLPALTGDVTSSAGSAATTAAATQSNITSIPNLATVGTITSGTWNAGAVTSSGTVTGANVTTAGRASIGGASAGTGSTALTVGDPSFHVSPSGTINSASVATFIRNDGSSAGGAGISVVGGPSATLGQGQISLGASDVPDAWTIKGSKAGATYSLGIASNGGSNIIAADGATGATSIGISGSGPTALQTMNGTVKVNAGTSGNVPVYLGAAGGGYPALTWNAAPTTTNHQFTTTYSAASDTSAMVFLGGDTAGTNIFEVHGFTSAASGTTRTTSASSKLFSVDVSGNATASKSVIYKSTTDSASTGALTKYVASSATTTFAAASTLTLNSVDATNATDGMVLYFINKTGNPLTVKYDGDATNAASQIRTKTAADVSIANYSAFQLVYAGIRWILIY